METATTTMIENHFIRCERCIEFLIFYFRFPNEASEKEAVNFQHPFETRTFCPLGRVVMGGTLRKFEYGKKKHLDGSNPERAPGKQGEMP
jgi:hypothetical protein